MGLMENNLLGAQQETRLRVEELEDRCCRAQQERQSTAALMSETGWVLLVSCGHAWSGLQDKDVEHVQPATASLFGSQRCTAAAFKDALQVQEQQNLLLHVQPPASTVVCSLPCDMTASAMTGHSNQPRFTLLVPCLHPAACCCQAVKAAQEAGCAYQAVHQQHAPGTCHWPVQTSHRHSALLQHPCAACCWSTRGAICAAGWRR